MPDKDSNDFAKWLISDERAKIQSPLLFDGSNWQPTRRLLGIFHGLEKMVELILKIMYKIQNDHLINSLFLISLARLIGIQFKGKK